MSTRSVKKGKHDFKPNIFPWPLRLVGKRLYFEFTLTESCWYNSLGSDNYDFNKGVGLFQWLDFAKNFNAIILGWRPKLDQVNYFECVPYENVNKGIFANEDKMRVFKSGEKISGYFEPKSDSIEMYLILKESVILWHKSKLNSCLYGIVDSWFGGNNVAVQDMNVELITKII